MTAKFTNQMDTTLTAFEVLMTAPNNTLNMAVEDFHNAVKKLCPDDVTEATRCITLSISVEMERLANRLHITFYDDELERDSLLIEHQDRMTETERRLFQTHLFLTYPWGNRMPHNRLLLMDCLQNELFFFTPDIILGECSCGALEKRRTMLQELFHTVSFEDFQHLAIPIHRDVECCLSALLTGRVPQTLHPFEDITLLEQMAIHQEPHEPIVQGLFRLHHTLMHIYQSGNAED